MSLQVWLPLNGDLHNQGLLGPMPENTDQGATNPFSQIGKIGKCLSYDNDYVTKIQDLSNNNLISLFGTGHVFSVAFWFKLKGVGTSAFLFQIGARINNTTFGFWWTNNTSRQGPRLVWNDGNSGTSTGLYVSAGYNTAIDYENWHHFVAIIDKRDQTQEVEKYYLDGQLIQTLNYNNSSAQQLVTDASNNFIYLRPRYAMYNDFRVYDHALSAKEIEELAKGLVLHYKLDNIYNSSYTNIYDAPYSEGSSSATDYVKTKLANENGYNYQLTYTGTGTDTYKWIVFPNFTFTAGKNYYFTCKIRCNSSSNISIMFRPARVTNDYATGYQYITVASNDLADGKWHTYDKVINIPATVVRNGSTINSNPRIEFATNNLKTSNTVYSIDLDIKDIAVIETDEIVGFIDNRFKTSTVYDSSGYGNHGTIVGSPIITNESPRYNMSTTFDNTQYIRVNNRPAVCMPRDAITVNLWQYATTWNNPISCTEGGGWNFENSNGIRFPVYISGVGYKIAQSSITPASTQNAWHMLTGTMNKDNVKIYYDGEEVGTIATDSTNGISYKNNYIFIAAEAAGDTTTPANSAYVGNISDVRIYATALTPEQIKELYTTSMSVDNNGNIHARELVEL